MANAETYLLTRHGESEHNLRTTHYMGRSPASRLTEHGRQQAGRLGAHLRGTGRVRHIVCSSLPRTVETAEIIAAALGIADVRRDDAFWELSKGAWEGTMPRDGVPDHYQRQLVADPVGFEYPGGESIAAVERRVGPAFRAWSGRLGPGVLFVLHGDVICALLHHLLRFPDAEISRYLVQPCSLTELTREAGAYRMLRFNEDVGG